MTIHDKQDSANPLDQKIKEIEQQKFILKETNKIYLKKISEQKKKRRESQEKLDEQSRKLKEVEQEKIILEEISELEQKKKQTSNKKVHILVSLLVIVTSIGIIGYGTYEGQFSGKIKAHDMSNYNSNYIIQNLQGDTVDTWVAWNIASGRVIHIHVTNTAQLPQNMIDTMKDAILSTKTVTIDDSLTGKGPKGSTSTYYTGWEGAIKDAYSEPTRQYIPQQFEIDGSPNGVGDIEIILTNDINPDGYSGYTKSLVDGNQILKSKITIFKANKLDQDRFASIIRHEFGHAMGLGHSTASEDLMSPMLPDYPYISSCDVDTLKGLYDGDQNSKVVCKK